MATSTARSADRPRPAVSRDGDRSLSSRWLLGLAALALLMLSVAWVGGWLGSGTDPRVAEILALQDQARERFGQLGDPGRGPATLGDATAAATAMMEIRRRTEALPEPLRQQVERNGRDPMRAAFRARIDRYFALPPEQRPAEIDRQINEEETWRKAFEAGRAVMGALGAGGQQPQAGGQQSQPAAGQAAQGGGPQGAGGGTPAASSQPWANRSEEERNRWRKGMIDGTTPEERARYTEWRRARDARREQLGLPERWPR